MTMNSCPLNIVSKLHGVYIKWYIVTCCARVNKNVQFATALDLNRCLKQTKFPISLHTYASISEKPSNISAVV